MSLTSYRAAPPRDKPLLRLHKKPCRNQWNQRVGAPIDPVRSFLRRQPGQRPWVRAVCTNANPLWKGLAAGFSEFYDG
jgi:hypothetical protein